MSTKLCDRNRASGKENPKEWRKERDEKLGKVKF